MFFSKPKAKFAHMSLYCLNHFSEIEMYVLINVHVCECVCVPTCVFKVLNTNQ